MGRALKGRDGLKGQPIAQKSSENGPPRIAEEAAKCCDGAMERREFLRGSFKACLIASGAAVGPILHSASVLASPQTRYTKSRYGPLSSTPDANGLLLPEGFTSKVVAVGGDNVAGSSYRWHPLADGAATFADGDGGWYYVCNSEVPLPGEGAVGAIHFDQDGEVKDAYEICSGTINNCAGGPTPWGTWLSCEEVDQGLVWECDPTGETDAVVRPALGRFAHEAVAVDPDDGVLYLTEDRPDSMLYRFVCDDYPNLDAGTLEAAAVGDDGSLTWIEVPDPTDWIDVDDDEEPVMPRHQLPEATRFNGAEGIWYHDRRVHFTTKGDNRVHTIDLDNQTIEVIWEAPPPSEDGEVEPALRGVDNITVDPIAGDLFVAEDGDDLEIVVISPEGDVAPFLQMVDSAHGGSELTGPVLSPDRTRLYFSSQRGPSNLDAAEVSDGLSVLGYKKNLGVTYEIAGPFETAPTPHEGVSVDGDVEEVGAAEGEAGAEADAEADASSASIDPETDDQSKGQEQAHAGVEGDSGDGLIDDFGVGEGIAVGVGGALAVAGAAAIKLRDRNEPVIEGHPPDVDDRADQGDSGRSRL